MFVNSSYIRVSSFPKQSHLHSFNFIKSLQNDRNKITLSRLFICLVEIFYSFKLWGWLNMLNPICEWRLEQVWILNFIDLRNSIEWFGLGIIHNCWTIFHARSERENDCIADKQSFTIWIIRAVWPLTSMNACMIVHRSRWVLHSRRTFSLFSRTRSFVDNSLLNVLTYNWKTCVNAQKHLRLRQNRIAQAHPTSILSFPT